MKQTVFRIFFILAEAAPAAVILVPAFLFLQKRYWHAKRRTALYLVFALYLCGVYVAAGLPHLWNRTFRPRINAELFAYMFSDSSSILNVLFFIPMGFLLPTIWNRFRAVYRTIPFCLGISVLIEGLQLFTVRATDVNDLMTNTLGAVIGYCLAMLLQCFFPAMKPDNDTRDVYWICAAVMAVMFFIHPILSYILFYCVSKVK